jgi:trigger factor
MEHSTLEDRDARMRIEVKGLREEDAFGCQLAVEVPAEEVDGQMEKAVTELRRDLSLPGFRKGKVPRSVIQARFGQDVRQEVIKNVVDEALWQAVREKDLKPIAGPQVSEVNYEAGSPLSFTAHVDVRPLIEIRDPAEIKVEKIVQPIEEEAVDRVLDGMRNRLAEFEPVDRAAEQGDVVTVDLAELGPGQVPIVGRRQTGLRFELVEGELPQPWIEGLTGRRAGASVAVEVPRAPEGELPDPGVPRYYQLELKQVESKSLPALDEALVGRFGAESLDQLKENVRTSLEREEDRRAQREVERQLLDRLATGVELEIPDRIVNPIADRLFERAVQEMRDLDAAGREGLAVEAREAATADVRRELVVAAVAQSQCIEVSQQEAESEYRQLERLERGSGEPRAELSGSERAERIERLREVLAERKVLKYIVDTADVQIVQRSSKRKRIITPYDS